MPQMQLIISLKKGVPFRDAHGIVGRIVLYCIDKGIAIDDMSIDELKAISPVFEEDVFDAISMETCVSYKVYSWSAIKDINGQGNCRLRRVYEVKLAG